MDPTSSSGKHDNPYGAGSQSAQNWNDQAAIMRQREQARQDADRMAELDRQTAADRARQAEERRQRQTTSRRPAPGKGTKSGPRGAKVHGRRGAGRPAAGLPQRAATGPQEPLHKGWALIGALGGGIAAYSLVPMQGDGRLLVSGIAALAAGAIFGRFYKGILVLAALGVGVWIFGLRGDKKVVDSTSSGYEAQVYQTPRYEPPVYQAPVYDMSSVSSVPVASMPAPAPPMATPVGEGPISGSGSPDVAKAAADGAADAARAAMAALSAAELRTLAETTERLIDEQRGEPYPSAPNCMRVMFQHNEFDVFVDRETIEAWIFHGPWIDHEALAYLEYHYQDQWVALVFRDGSRGDLGAPIRWLIRPYWREAEFVCVAQTRDGAVVSETTVPLLKIGKKPPRTVPLPGDASSE